MIPLIAQVRSTVTRKPTRKRGTPPLPMVTHLRVYLTFTHAVRCYALLIANFVVISTAHAQAMQLLTKDEPQIAVGYDQIHEIIRKRCVTCHNPDEMRGDLDLSTLPAILAGATSGPVVVAGKPNQSLLYKSAAHLDDPAMPPNSPKIPGRELDLLRRWVEGGLAERTGPSGGAQGAQAQGGQAQVKPEMEAKEPMGTASNRLSPHPLNDINETGMVSVRPILRPAPIAALDAHPKESIIAVSGNQQAVLLDISTGEWLGAFNFPEGDVTALRFSHDGKLLVVAGGVAGLSGRVVAFDLATGQRSFELADEKDTILSVDLSPDGSMVALGGPAKVVRIYKVSSGEVLQTLRKHTDWVLTVRFSPDGLLLASGDRFGGIFAWDPRRGAEFHTLRGHVGPVHSVAWGVDSETLVSGGEDGQIRTWNLHHGELTAQWDSGVGAILSLDTNSSFIACGGRNKSVTIWNGPEQKVSSYVGPDQVERVVIPADGKSLIFADAAGIVSKVEPTSSKTHWSLSLPVDESELQIVFKRIEQAASDYAIRRTESNKSAPSTADEDADAKVNANIQSNFGLLALQSSLHASRQNLVMLRENVAANSKTLSATSIAIQQLQQSHLELQSQLERQQVLVDTAEQQTAAMEAAVAKILSTNPQLTHELNQQQRKSLKEKLARQKKLLAASLQLLDQVNESNERQGVDADLQKTQSLVIAVTDELRLRVKEVSSMLDAVEGKSESRDSLVGAEQ